MIRTYWKPLLLWPLAALSALLLAGWIWWSGLDFSHGGGNPAATRADLPWLSSAVPPRGRILAVVTSASRALDGSTKVGYELTELSRAWWVFEAAGFAVDLASPEGGTPPQVLDDGLVDADYAFLNDPQTRAAITQSLRLDQVDPADYVGVYVVGGKGVQIDLYRHPALQHILAEVYGRGGVIAAVCHGPAALLDVALGDGRTLLGGRRVTGFSNAEELFLMENPIQKLGFLLEDALDAEGEFVEATQYLEHVVADGRVITGQNPWSTWALAEQTVRLLGATPAPRPRSPEEHAVDVLLVHAREGAAAARAAKAQLDAVDNRLMVMHAVVAAMQGQYRRSWELARLARH